MFIIIVAKLIRTGNDDKAKNNRKKASKMKIRYCIFAWLQFDQDKQILYNLENAWLRLHYLKLRRRLPNF